MRSTRLFRRIALLLIPILGTGFSRILAADAFPNRLEPSVLESAKLGPNASVYVRREIPVLMRSDQAVNVLNFSSATAKILMLGKYHSPNGMLDLELQGSLQAGTLEIDLPMGKLDAALYEWEELLARSKDLDNLNAHLQGLTFKDTTGFRAIYHVKRSIEFQLTLDVPYNADTQTLGGPSPSFKAAADFIRYLEKDSRSRTILESNTSGLPVFVSAGDTTGSLAAGFLADTIRFDPVSGRREFGYTGRLSRLSQLPEVKRVIKDPAVKAFIDGPEDVLIKALGSDDAGFSFTISKEGGKHIDATLLGKRVTLKS